MLTFWQYLLQIVVNKSNVGLHSGSVILLGWGTDMEAEMGHRLIFPATDMLGFNKAYSFLLKGIVSSRCINAIQIKVFVS